MMTSKPSQSSVLMVSTFLITYYQDPRTGKGSKVIKYSEYYPKVFFVITKIHWKTSLKTCYARKSQFIEDI